MNLAAIKIKLNLRSKVKSKIIALIALLISVGVTFSHAQDNLKHEYRYQNYFDIAGSASSGQFSAALSWSHLHGVGKKKQKFKIGYGVRLTSFAAANKYYTTAPSKYTSDAQNPFTISSPTIAENIDTLTTATTQTNSLNLAIYLQYDVSPRFDIGFNIDAIGFSFGAEKDFNILSSVYDPGQAPVQPGSPTTFNLLLTSDNDIGSLNSEFYLRYWITKKIGIRAGYTFIFSEYRTNQNLSFDNSRIVNDRFRYKASMILVAVSYRPFNKTENKN